MESKQKHTGIYASTEAFIHKTKRVDIIPHPKKTERKETREMIKKLKEKKGFTLVELIVVLVILAILAALLIPALTGYIDKAKNKSIVAETRQAVMAAQTLVDEAYAKDQAAKITIEAEGTIKLADVKELAETEQAPTSATVEDGKVTELVYENGGKTCTYRSNGKTVGDETQEGKYFIKK